MGIGDISLIRKNVTMLYNEIWVEQPITITEYDLAGRIFGVCQTRLDASSFEERLAARLSEVLDDLTKEGLDPARVLVAYRSAAVVAWQQNRQISSSSTAILGVAEDPNDH